MKFTIIVKESWPGGDCRHAQFEHEFFTWEAAVFEAVAQVKALNEDDEVMFELVSVTASPKAAPCMYCERQIAANERFCSDDCAEAFGSADSQSFIDGERADRERRAEDRDRYGY